jgi:BMFP domain-containing protein YqiC
MDDPGSDLYGEDPYGDEPDPVERFLSLIGPRVDELRSLLEEATSRWRGDAVRIGEGGRQRINRVLYEMGLITREDWDDLDLRVAQLEHRVRLLEERDQPRDDR